MNQMTSRFAGPLDFGDDALAGAMLPAGIDGFGVGAWYWIQGDETLNQSELDKAEVALSDVQTLVAAAFVAFAAELTDPQSTSSLFRGFHLEEIPEEMVCDLFDVDTGEVVTDGVFLDHLVLVGITISPAATERVLALDFAIGADKPTDQLLVAVWDRNGAVTVHHES
ncbi:DUF2004 domain-containing protein [Rhodococcus sp. AG1013]|uniref:DUF2004 domain-containing protein n=1 Tax=Rhodococcus sp. AG1013 TaxID=2183996 RepID=UPI000E0C6937|nr:DUF2004 domain-containing protein [Rhodococcus sp. AG1013]